MSSLFPSASRAVKSASLGLATAGLGLLVAAWLLPVNLKSLNPVLLREAGRGTPTVAECGLALVGAEKPGPAQLVLAAAQALGDPGAPRLAAALAAFAARSPELMPWGGWDPFLDPLFNLKENTGAAGSVPVLNFFVTRKARASLRAYLANSRSQGVQTVLATREITRTLRFVPASQAGGQPLEAVILLTALLYQGEHLSPALQPGVRLLAEAALRTRELGAIEDFYFDLLSLGRRLDWIQLCELMRLVNDGRTLNEFAHLAQVAPENLPILYTAALFSKNAGRVADYTLNYGKPGVEALRLSLRCGQGALQQLLLRQAPVSPDGPAFGFAATFSLLHPKLALAVKYLGFFAGVFLMLRGLDRLLFVPARRAAGAAVQALPRIWSGLLAFVFSFLLVVLTEPFLLKAAPSSEYRLKLVIPVLSLAATPPVVSSTTHTTMDIPTLLSVCVFALMQISMYVLCLLKIGEINRQPLPTLLKLRLMENEENLFDGGLYLGIAGTATALVLQVLGLIQANLLAAYSSNLFGILCVALVKIRHVRPYKRKLIMESQSVAPAPGK